MTFILILAINIILLVLVRTDRRYWLVSIPLWTIVISSFVLWRNFHDKKIDQIETEYWKSADANKKLNPDNSSGDRIVWKELESSKDYVQKFNMIFLHSVFLQTILTFISQIIGYKKTNLKKTYKWTSIIFGVLTLLSLFLELMIAIVPTT